MPTKADADEIYQTTSGPATDEEGRAVLDPTKNVLDLVRAAVLRLDDMATLREKAWNAFHNVEMRRIDERNAMQSKYVTDTANLRADHEKEIRLKETQRLDAIRAVDVAAVAEASRVATSQASILASQVQASAEALRTQVGTVATATQAALAAALEPIQKSIDDLRKTQYEQQGQKAAASETKGDTRDTHDSNRWAIGLAITIAIVLVNIGVAIFLKVILK